MARSGPEPSHSNNMYDRIRLRRQLRPFSEVSDRSSFDRPITEAPFISFASSSSNGHPFGSSSSGTTPRSRRFGMQSASEPSSPSTSARFEDDLPSTFDGTDLSIFGNRMGSWDEQDIREMMEREVQKEREEMIREREEFLQDNPGLRGNSYARNQVHTMWEEDDIIENTMTEMSAEEREIFGLDQLEPISTENGRRHAGDGQTIGTHTRLLNIFRSRRRDGARPPGRTSDPNRGMYNSDHDWTGYRSNAPIMEEPKPSAAFLYSVEPAFTGSDVWPDIRDRSKVPAKYIPIDLSNHSKSNVRARPTTTASRKTATDTSAEITKSKSTPTWPMGQLPSEIYYLITDSLTRDDIKTMRLTCRELEHHISCVLFKTVVVPFNTEIYGMLQGTSNAKIDVNGKGKMKADSAFVGFWKNSTAEDIYTGHGIDVFRSFGSRMKKFGMSFEVDEDALANPPLKGSREAHKSYWGEYTWPYPEYHRFEQVAGLEDAADETPRMKFAFSLLGSVQELALSLDSGLGWISGPDQSLRSRVLRKPPPVFGTIHRLLERKIQAQQDFWDHLKRRSAEPGGCDLRQATFYHREMATSQYEFQTLKKGFVESGDKIDIPYINLRQIIDPTVNGAVKLEHITSQTTRVFGTPETQDTPLITPLIPSGMHFEEAEDGVPPEREIIGGMLMVKEDTADQERVENYPIVPANLSKLQKEWLLETEWAQRAFLSSYLLAIVDNRNTFHNVHTINFSRISSRYLLSLARNDFWNALPNLKTVNLQVIADWRDVVKDNAGFVETPRITLAAATSWFYRLLFYMIVPRRNITSLNIGWACGGEHAQGLHARNKYLMPAPFLSSDWMSTPENMANKELMVHGMLDLRYIEELTLKNCWMPPDALVSLVTKHPGLTKLTLDSVSLSAPLTVFNGGNNNNNNPLPNANNNNPVPQQILNVPGPIANQAPGAFAHLTAAQFQYLQNLQAQAQQLHNLANPQNFPNLAQWANVPPPPPPQAPVGNISWLDQHRAGSWPHVIDVISPGTTLASHGSTTSPTNVIITNPAYKLKVLEFRSCGYCRLNNCRFDEGTITLPTNHGGNAWFTKRTQALNKVMMKDKYNWIADIVQHVPQHEQEALENGWDMHLGWDDVEEAEGPTFDACLPGGTGRFSGEVTISSRAPPTEDEG